MRSSSFREWGGAGGSRGAAVDRAESKRAAAWLDGRLSLLPARWAAHVGAEHRRRGGLAAPVANRWLLAITGAGEKLARLPLAASDDCIREAARVAAREGVDIAILAGARGGDALRVALESHCKAWGIEPPQLISNQKSGKKQKVGDVINDPLETRDFPLGVIRENPALNLCDSCNDASVRRMLCPRWWLRRLRRAHGRRCESAAIRGGVVRRGLWPYASQDAVERRTAQRRRNASAIEKAVIECQQSGEALPLAEVVAGSLANPENKRAELMVRVRGCDAIANEGGHACEFWTVTAPSRFHAQRVTGSTGEPNPAFCGATPKDGQQHLNKVWARARAAWKRRGLNIYGMRTAEPHHDGCPHWHVIAYGEPGALVLARELLKAHALSDTPEEPGAGRHRMTVLQARGAKGAAYAAKYVSKNIDGGGMDGARDDETGRKISSTVVRVDTWAAAWGIRQFQFFGCPAVGLWRALRRIEEPGKRDSNLERARLAARDTDFPAFWRAAVAGGLELIKRAASRLTAYGDTAPARVVGVTDGARRVYLKLKEWVIRWGGAAKNAAGVVFDFPRSGLNNCTRGWLEDAAGAIGIPEISKGANDARADFLSSFARSAPGKLTRAGNLLLRVA